MAIIGKKPIGFIMALAIWGVVYADPCEQLQERVDEITTARLILHENLKAVEPYTVRYEEHPFIVYPGVFSPKFFPDTYFFADHLTIIPGESFLEIGSGTGLISVMAALRGAGHVTAVDINPEAVRNTADNVFRHHLKPKFKLYAGDLFDPIPQDAKYDTIFWFAPFMHIERDRAHLTDLERSIFDPHYEGIKRYLTEARNYLKPGGRLLLGFSSSHGDLGVLQQLAEEGGLKIEVLAQEEGSIPRFPGVQSVDAFSVMLLQLTPWQIEAPQPISIEPQQPKQGGKNRRGSSLWLGV